MLFRSTFTTADVVPTAGVTYTITAISGTYNRGNTIYDILGLETYLGATNTFQWDGTSSSPLFSSNGGISFQVSDNTDYQLVNLFYYTEDAAYGPVDHTSTEFPDFVDGHISTSSLKPANPVPGPLPLFGAAAAFSWSRRLRRRIPGKI